MNENKIAILVDSCTDVPEEYRNKYGIYVAPMTIKYKNEEYIDGVNITSQQVCDNFEKEIPKTSLPCGDVISQQLQKIKDDGFQKVLIITISSGLSGTYNMMQIIADDFSGLRCIIVDTKNIGIGAGFTVIRAAELIEEGKDIDEIEKELLSIIPKTKVFFCIPTLEYLRKGGRIGLVSSMIGSALGLKPIISCNDDGVYYTAHKVRGRENSLKQAVKMALDFAKNSAKYNLAIVHSNAKEEAEKIKTTLLKHLPYADIIIEGQIGPALIVHTGPGLIGIGIQKLT